MDKDFNTCSTAGNNLIIDIFEYLNKQSNKYKFEIIIENDEFSRNDAILILNNRKYLIEHKNRDFNNNFLKKIYKNKFILEKYKFDELQYKQQLYQYDGIYYINSTNDDFHYIFNISNLENAELTFKYCPRQTCGNQQYKEKKNYLLNVDSALLVRFN